jgi:hypothetical protein
MGRCNLYLLKPYKAIIHLPRRSHRSIYMKAHTIGWYATAEEAYSVLRDHYFDAAERGYSIHGGCTGEVREVVYPRRAYGEESPETRRLHWLSS